MTAEVTESRSQARAGTLTLLTLGGALAHRAMIELLSRGLPGGPSGPTIEELEADEFGDYEDEEDELYGSGGGDAPPPPEDSDPEMMITEKGEGVLSVLESMRHWLGRRPGGTPAGGYGEDEDAGDGAGLTGLICGWSSTIVHALAREPLTLEELDRAVGMLDRAEVEEHLSELEEAGLAEALTHADETRYAPTEWLRQGIGPIVAAVRQERHYPEAHFAPPDILDIEAAFQLALPLLRLPPGLYGSCRLGVLIPDGPPLMAGATVEVDRGSVLSSTPLLDEAPENRATGSPRDWCDTVMDPAAAKLEVGGDPELADALIQALNEVLFGGPVGQRG